MLALRIVLWGTVCVLGLVNPPPPPPSDQASRLAPRSGRLARLGPNELKQKVRVLVRWGFGAASQAQFPCPFVLPAH